MVDTSKWMSTEFHFHLDGKLLVKERGTVHYEIDACLYEFEEDDIMPSLILWALQMGAPT